MPTSVIVYNGIVLLSVVAIVVFAQGNWKWMAVLPVLMSVSGKFN